MAAASLSDLPNEILIDIIAFLTIPAILVIRQVSTRLHALSRVHTIWRSACTQHVLARGFPFPSTHPLDALSAAELERLTRRAFRLGEFWLSPPSSHSPGPKLAVTEFLASSSMPVSDVRFVPAHPDWLITVSRGAWPVLICWDISQYSPSDPRTRPRKIAQWSPRGVVLTTIAVNSAAADGSDGPTLAVTAMHRNTQAIHVLTVRSEDARFAPVRTIKCRFRVIALQGDILAISNDGNETHLINWRAEGMPRVVLRGNVEEPLGPSRHHRCLQVLLTPYCTLVARQCSLEAYAPTLPESSTQSGLDNPLLYPIARYPFNELRAFAMSQGPQPPPPPIAHKAEVLPLSVVLRPDATEPRALGVQSVMLYSFPVDQPTMLEPDPNASPDENAIPYVFSPLQYGTRKFPGGPLHYPHILLGPHGTALWIRPRPVWYPDLTQFDVHAFSAQGSEHNPFVGEKEAVVAEVCAGVLQSRNRADGDGDGGEAGEIPSRLRELWTLDDPSASWTAMDYDETRGLVALGDNYGKVVVLDLVP
ncbi:hypothetical protein BDW22DRAFT_1359352 [Trametopsis cervina]|nr:hypothetical protein BDW22DRAFT_1359352 [Trametopsis cervina]